MSENVEAPGSTQAVSESSCADRIFAHQVDDLIRVVKSDLGPVEIEKAIRKLVADKVITPRNVQELITERAVGTSAALRVFCSWCNTH
jgi:hypothetical protein